MIFNEKYNNTIRFALGVSSEFYNIYTNIILNLPEEILEHAKSLQSIRYEVDGKLYEIFEFRNQTTKQKEIKIIQNDYRNKAGFVIHVSSIDEKLLQDIKEKEIASIAIEKNGQSIDCSLTLKKENDNEYTLINKTVVNQNRDSEPTTTTYTIEELKRELKLPSISR